MGTFHDSKIVRARKRYSCTEWCREGGIFPGELYLRYKAGLRNDIPVCLGCASRRVRGLNSDCAALRTALLGAP